MEQIKFSTKINAKREAVWKVLWGDETYRQWTKPFSEESHAKSDWQEGSRAEFLDGNNCGMYSLIEQMIENEFMSFKHLGSIKDGTDIPFEGEMASWANTHEDYSLSEENGVTKLTAEMDVGEEFKDFMNEKMPVALAKVKELSES